MELFAGVWEFVTSLAASRRWVLWTVLAIMALSAGIWVLEAVMR